MSFRVDAEISLNTGSKLTVHLPMLLNFLAHCFASEFTICLAALTRAALPYRVLVLAGGFCPSNPGKIGTSFSRPGERIGAAFFCDLALNLLALFLDNADRKSTRLNS